MRGCLRTGHVKGGGCDSWIGPSGLLGGRGTDCIRAGRAKRTDEGL